VQTGQKPDRWAQQPGNTAGKNACQLIYIYTPFSLQESDTISRHANHGRGTARAQRRSREGMSTIPRYLLLIALAILLIAVPVSAGTSNASVQKAGTGPETVYIGVYVVDFNRFDVAAGTVGIDYYLHLRSDSPISIDDLELMNGVVSSVSTVTDTPNEKEYRVLAVLKTEPDLSRYPFDRHTLPIRIEPKSRNEREMILVADPKQNGVDPDANLPGWAFTGTGFTVANMSYIPGEIPFSRAVFSYGITRDTTSTILKFFLPIMLIIIVSLSSLMMKISSRLGLNASMFLAAVLIHWRVADAIPLVAYATFLDLFMIITYATLVMVLVSGILILKFTGDENMLRVEQINRWSIRIIPALSIALYFLLFLTLVV
jgi:hypothetical protein